jgi:hypothetical protein
MKSAWSNHGGNDKFYVLIGNLMTKEHFGGLRVNVSIILKQPAAELL